MSVEQREQRLEELEAQLADAKQKLETWKQRRQDTLDGLHESFDAGDEETERYQKSVVLAEAREAVQHFGQRVSDLEGAVKDARRALKQARYEKRQTELSKLRKETRAKLVELEQEFLDTLKRVYEESWRAQEDYNHKVGPVNSLASGLGERRVPQVKRMNGLDAFRYAENLMREALASGDLS